VHLAEDLLGGMRGFLARSSHHGCHLGLFIRESSGLQILKEPHVQGHPYWHGVACVQAEVRDFGRLQMASAHLAPSSPSIRTAEAEAFKLVAEAGPLIAGGDWNAVPVSDPDPDLAGKDHEHIRRKLDRTAARALEDSGLTDIGAYAQNLTPTVGYSSSGRLAYRCDRIYTNLSTRAIVSYEVITDVDDCSDHRPVAATFDLQAAADPETA
jgi:endonuclease/exonuclease/phosphatase family metal-dependent hydrolase